MTDGKFYGRFHGRWHSRYYDWNIWSKCDFCPWWNATNIENGHFEQLRADTLKGLREMIRYVESKEVNK